MTTETIPELTLPWRMKLALDHAHITVGGMADYLGVDRNTVGNWINGRNSPKTHVLRLWSMRCGVPFGWLVTGENAPAGGEVTVPKARPSRAGKNLGVLGDKGRELARTA